MMIADKQLLGIILESKVPQNFDLKKVLSLKVDLLVQLLVKKSFSELFSFWPGKTTNRSQKYLIYVGVRLNFVGK